MSIDVRPLRSDDVPAAAASSTATFAVGAMLALRLPFRPADSLAVRGFAPRLPYLPDGAYG